MPHTSHEAELIIASTDNADMYYATRFVVPDSFIFIRIRSKSTIIMSDLEIDRARQQAQVNEVRSFSELAKVMRNGKRKWPPTMAHVAAFFLRAKQIKKLRVPADFPIAYADALRSLGFNISPSVGPFFKQRIIKTKDEISAIEKTQRCTEAIMRAAIDMIRKATIRGAFLYHGTKKLTSESVQRRIDEVALSLNCLALHTIVSSGKQTCDPHQVGYGPLPAHQAIILDIFPRSLKTFYFADMTRTIVRGKASKALKRLYRTVKRGQDIGLSMVREGVNGKSVHTAITQYFKKEGYETGSKNGRMQGFFHGTGHGLGLEVHEAPRVSFAEERLRAGMVVTVEPGLYYPNIGGVRLEDLVLVEKRGNRDLTRCSRVLEV